MILGDHTIVIPSKILHPDRVDICPLGQAAMCPNHVGETLPCFLFGRGIECTSKIQKEDLENQDRVNR